MIDFNNAERIDQYLARHGVESMEDLVGEEGEPHDWVVQRDEEYERNKLGANSNNGASASPAAAEQYVKYRDIKDAVRGHEQAILHAVGIKWTTSRGHIDCPYPRHGGKTDWRWDAGKGVAFCSCVGKEAAHRRDQRSLGAEI
jgi:hypothetical protein